MRAPGGAWTWYFFLGVLNLGSTPALVPLCSTGMWRWAFGGLRAPVMALGGAGQGVMWAAPPALFLCAPLWAHRQAPNLTDRIVKGAVAMFLSCLFLLWIQKNLVATATL